MAKIETDIAKKILERNEVEVRKRNQIMQDIKHVLEQEALEKEMKPPTEKKEFVILISDPKGVLKAAYPDGVVGWVLQIPEGEAPHGALGSLHASAYDHNASPKGRKFPVETIGEACETLSAKTTKEHKVWIKTKIAVLAITTDNILPKAPGLPD
jgi:hypothetical protein